MVDHQIDHDRSIGSIDHSIGWSNRSIESIDHPINHGSSDWLDDLPWLIGWSIDPIDRLDDQSILWIYHDRSDDLSILLIYHDRSDDLP